MNLASATVEELIAVLQRGDADSAARHDAAETLGERRVREAVPALTAALADRRLSAVLLANALVAISDRRSIPSLEAAYARSKEACAGAHTNFCMNERLGLLTALVRFRDKAGLDELLETGDACERYHAEGEVSARCLERRMRELVTQGTDVEVAIRALHVAGGDENRWLGRAVAALTGVSDCEGRLVVVKALHDQRN